MDELGTVTGSYANYRKERSIVENDYTQLPVRGVANSDDVEGYEDVASDSDNNNAADSDNKNTEILETIT